jgi:hypothetical protein
MVSAEPTDERREGQIGHHRQMCRRVTGVDLRATSALEQRNGSSGSRDQIRRRESGDAAANDDDVHASVALKLGKPRQ